MTDTLDRLLSDASPISDDEVRALSLDTLEVELRESILLHGGERPRSSREKRRRWRLPALATAAAAAAVLLAVTIIGGGDSAERAWAAPALEVANGVPRLLVGQPGWKVTRADQFTVGEGEMTFGDGARTVDLHWRTGDHARWVEDRAYKNLRLDDMEVLGTRAQVFRYSGSHDDHTALLRRGRYTIEVRAQAPESEFRAIVGSLRQVGVDRWLSAMPATVVLPRETDEVVEGMLAGMTLPEGFDASALRSDAVVRDRYQLGARVAGAVACAWIERWIEARRTGDADGAATAVRAMEGSRRWPILLEMQAEGDYPEVLWEYAGALAGDGTVVGGRVLSVEESYEAALGC
jgi:hypothetical protein